MKTNWLVGSVFLAGAMVLQAQTNDLSAALRQGLFEEEANRNLDAAISNYQSLATQFDQDRQVAATAIFRLGECYRKLGQDNDAVVQYQRILREFSDQPTLATLSRQNLTALHAAVPPQLITAPQLPAPAGTFQQRLQRIITKVPQDSAAQTSAESAAKATELEAEAASLKAQIAHLSSLSGEDRRTAIQQNFPNPVLTTLMQQLNEAEQNLASLTNDYTPTDLHVTRVTAQLNAINGQIDTQVEGVIKGLQAKMEVDLSAAKALRDQSGPVQAVHAEASTATNEEDQEIRRIQQLIQNSPDLINAPASDGFTPLGNAARNGQVKVATFLLDHGAGINVAQRAGVTALHGAARAGNRTMVELLLSRGADVNSKEVTGQTPLHIAANKGFQAVVEVLLANKVDVNAQDDSGNTPLHLAADGQMKIIQMLLAAGANPNVENKLGRTPLSFAAGSGSLEAVQAFLNAKADPNGGKLDAPLLGAIYKQNAASAELLLQAGANPNAVGRANWSDNNDINFLNSLEHITPIWVAVYLDKFPMVQLLLKFKADPNDSQSDGRPLLFSALSDPDILGALLDAGGKVDSRDSYGWPLLNAAVIGNNPAIVQTLLHHGADVNIRKGHGGDVGGYTPLHVAASVLADRKIVEMLLENKADPNIRGDDGNTPLDLVKQKLAQYQDPQKKAAAGSLAGLLRQHGALDNLPHWDRITVSRPSANYSEAVFRKGTNDWNQISLFDVLGVQYELINNSQSEPQRGNSVPYSYYAGNNSLPFPDLANIIIRRATADGKGWENRTIDLASALNSGNCAVDLQLRWGDVVEIPEKDHVLNERWPGLSTNELFTLKNCLTRHLQISVKGQITNIVITPQIKELVPGSREYPLSSYGAKMEPAVSLLKFEPFMLWPVLKDSKLLLASSDLSHIKVKRRDITTGKMHEWMVDCSNPQAPPNLWLRDGDVIEVPEKP